MVRWEAISELGELTWNDPNSKYNSQVFLPYWFTCYEISSLTQYFWYIRNKGQIHKTNSRYAAPPP